MTAIMHRAAIVGASSLLGKELADELNRAGGAFWDLTLLEAGDSAGEITAAGDEALVIQALTHESFAGMDIVFFAADAATTGDYWRYAVAAGAGVVDLTGALAVEPGVATRAPLLAGAGLVETRLDLSTEAVVCAHALTLMLGYVLARLQAEWSEAVSSAATVLLPASEQGKQALDELHAQTVALLSFQTLPRETCDAQVAFNVLSGFGHSARVNLGSVAAKAAAELDALFGTEIADRCAFQCLQAPVFHGCSASVFLRFEQPVSADRVRDILQHPALLTVAAPGDDPPSNASANEQEAMQGSLQAASTNGKDLWLWLVADNLRLMARNAVACAAELRAILPASRRVQ